MVVGNGLCVVTGCACRLRLRKRAGRASEAQHAGLPPHRTLQTLAVLCFCQSPTSHVPPSLLTPARSPLQCPSLLSSGAEKCQECLAGTWPTADKSTCELCPGGYYSTVAGSPCKKCPVGTFRVADGGDGTECTMCGPGTYNNQEGQTECTDCAEGYAQEKQGQTACIAW